MDDKRRTKLSKFLSKHLRHEPDAIGLQLDAQGWAEVSALLEACARNGMAMSRDELNEVVNTNDKKRFAFDASGDKIRASQGHSIAVDLGLEPQTPPDELFHGTAQSTLELVLRDGLRSMSRQHVHLSLDRETATRVGSRHGKPVVLRVDARRMHEAGMAFFVSENGVWLCERVPPEFLSLS